MVGASSPVRSSATAWWSGALAAAGGHDDRLAELIAGATWATWAFDEIVSCRLTASGDGLRLDGTVAVVADGDRCGLLLVPALGPEGPAQVLVATDAPGVTIGRLTGLDVTRHWATVTFTDVAVGADDLVGRAGAATEAALAHQAQVAAVLVAAESVGAMRADLDMAVAYAKDRVAFGRPIGSFQAVKHLLADTSLALEMAMGVVAAAATALGAGDARRPELASMPPRPSWPTHGIELAQNCFQVFGGIGYTWEHDQHLYLRRLAADAALYGDAGLAPRATARARRAVSPMTDGADVSHRAVPRRGPSLDRGEPRAAPARRGQAAASRGTSRSSRPRSWPASGPSSAECYEAGYAGITLAGRVRRPGPHPRARAGLPRGGRRLLPPDLGIAGGATFGVCAPTMLAHASPSSSAGVIPKMLSGDLIVVAVLLRARAPAPTSPACAPRPCATATAGSSTARRSGAAARTTPTTACASPAPTGTCPKHRGLTWFAVPTDAKGVTIERIRQINDDAEFCQEFLDDVELTDDDIIGEVDDGWSVTQTMLLYERGAGSAGGGASKGSGGAGRPARARRRRSTASTTPRSATSSPASTSTTSSGPRLGRRLLALMTADMNNAGNLASYGKLASGVLRPDPGQPGAARRRALGPRLGVGRRPRCRRPRSGC